MNLCGKAGRKSKVHGKKHLMALKIDFHKLGLEQPNINTWFGGMYRSFFSALRECGCQVTYSDRSPNMEADVMIVTMGGGQDKDSVRAMDRFNGPVIMNIGAADYWFKKELLERWRDLILFMYGNDLSDFSVQQGKAVGISYYHFPFGSNPQVMRPLHLKKLYDVVFVANADSGLGRRKFIAPLIKSAKSYKILLLGSGWEEFGYPLQSIAWGETLNAIYNLSKICVNIANEEQISGSNKRQEANNRLFDLGMAGCFQVSNAKSLVRNYFSEQEVVVADSPKEWVDVIMYYLEHPDEMASFCEAAHKRAILEHTWLKRAEYFLEKINLHLSTWNREQQLTPKWWNKICRYRDMV
jgi:hypothetical protein